MDHAISWGMSQLVVKQRYQVGQIESTEDIHSGYGFAIGNVAAFDMGLVLKQGAVRKLKCLNMDHQMRMWKPSWMCWLSSFTRCYNFHVTISGDVLRYILHYASLFLSGHCFGCGVCTGGGHQPWLLGVFSHPQTLGNQGLPEAVVSPGGVGFDINCSETWRVYLQCCVCCCSCFWR